MKRTIAAAVAAVAFASAVPAHATDYILLANGTGGLFYDNFHVTSQPGAIITAASISTTPLVADFSDRYFFALLTNQSGSGAVQSDQNSLITFNLSSAAIPGLTLKSYSLDATTALALQDAFTNPTYNIGAPSDLSVVSARAVGANLLTTVNGQDNGQQRVLSPTLLTAGVLYEIGVTGHSPNPGNSLYTGQFTVTPVPEPATWAMMLAGFGLIGFAMRRQRQSHPKVRFAF